MDPAEGESLTAAAVGEQSEVADLAYSIKDERCFCQPTEVICLIVMGRVIYTFWSPHSGWVQCTRHPVK